MPFIESHQGELLSLLSAVVWAVSLILFKKSGESVHPIALNLFKDTMGALLFLFTMLVVGETLFRECPTEEYLLLIASGALGIGLGDTLLFMSVNRLGAGLFAVVACLYSPMVILLAFLFLNESMTMWQLFGTTFIILALFLTSGEARKGRIERKDFIWGLILGLLANISMAVGIVMVKPLLDRSPVMWTTEIRIFGGIVTLLIVLLCNPNRRNIVSTMTRDGGLGYTIAGSFLGAYVAMFIWMAGMKYAEASIASILNQLSNIFVFVLAAIFLHENVTWRRIGGILLGVGGAVLVTVG